MQKIPGQKRNDKNDIRTPKKGNLSSYRKAGQPSGKSDSWTLSGKTEKDFCAKMGESTRAVPQVIGTRKNGSQYFIPIVEETSAENWADLASHQN